MELRSSLRLVSRVTCPKRIRTTRTGQNIKVQLPSYYPPRGFSMVLILVTQRSPIDWRISVRQVYTPQSNIVILRLIHFRRIARPSANRVIPSRDSCFDQPFCPTFSAAARISHQLSPHWKTFLSSFLLDWILSLTTRCPSFSYRSSRRLLDSYVVE